MSTDKKVIEKHFYNNTFIKYFTITLLVLITILFVWQWISLNDNFNSFRDESQEQFKSLENTKTNLIELSNVEKDSLNYIFRKQDIASINNKLNILAFEIYDQRNRAESIIDKDLDRLNLYMAVGIGFLALLGVFVPLLINLLSNDDLKKKMAEIVADLKSNKNEVKNLGISTEDLKKKSDQIDLKKINEAVEKSKEIDRLKTNTDEIIPKLSIISLQIAIHRLFNVSSITLTESRENADKIFCELFENIKVHLKSCNDDENLIINNSPVMQQTLLDFVALLDNDSFKFTSYLQTRKIGNKIDSLIDNLKILSKVEDEEQTDQFHKVVEFMEELISEIGKYHSDVKA